MKTRTLFPHLLLVLGLALPALAAPEFSIPDKEIEVQFGKALHRTKRVLIPSGYVEVMNWGKISSVTQTSALQSMGGASNSTVRASMEVAVPSDVAALRVVSAELYADLAAQLRAAGWEVVTHEDLKAEPAIGGLDRHEPDAKLGAPIRKVTVGKQKMQYTVVAPEGMPVIKAGLLNPLWALRHLAKQKNGNILLVVYRFDPVALSGTRRRGFGSNSASTSAEANLVLALGNGMFITPKGDLGGILTKNPIAVVGGIGEITKVADLSPTTANALSAGLSFLGGGSISSKKGLYVCQLDEVALKESLLVAGKAFNAQLVKAFGAP